MQKRGLDGLDHVIAGAQFHGAGDYAVVSHGGEDQHARGLLALLQLGEHAQAVHARHDDVQQQHVRLLRGAHLQRGQAVGRFAHHLNVLIGGQLLRDILSQGGVVIRENQANGRHVDFPPVFRFYINSLCSARGEYDTIRPACVSLSCRFGQRRLQRTKTGPNHTLFVCENSRIYILRMHRAVV